MKINLSKLDDAINAAFSATVSDVANASKNAIESERWAWANTTVRSDGSVVGSPRDIVDTGELRDSQEVSIEDNEATIAYTADHAQIVHSDRPFLKTALDETPIAKRFAKHLGDQL